MSRVRAAMLFLSLVAVSGCDDQAVVTYPQEVADFTEMRALWDAQGIDDYDIDLGIGSEAAVETTLRFEVRGSETSRVFDLVVGWRTPTASERRLTIDSLYARMAAEDADPDANVVTRFDTRNGLLTYSSADRPSLTNDAYWFTVKRFKQR